MLLEHGAPGVAVITLDHPPANAIGYEQIETLTRALDEAEASGDCLALVIRAAGRFFCAGADIRIMSAEAAGADRADRLAAFALALQELCERIERFPAPTLAAVRGTATGGGLELAMACDLRIVAREALVGLPETKLGLIPGAGGTQRLTELIGRARASDLILRGRLIGGEEAARIGLATEAVAAERVEPRALEIATELAAQPREALREAKRCIALARSDGGFKAEIEATRALHRHPETIERIAAFLARRSAK
jgi:enoyl-CoA hydratase/carnithine racemase